jgi:hypothetical protein
MVEEGPLGISVSFQKQENNTEISSIQRALIPQRPYSMETRFHLSFSTSFMTRCRYQVSFSTSFAARGDTCLLLFSSNNVNRCR